LASPNTCGQSAKARFVVMALATGTGAEVQKPLATVVIGGLISATLLTLIVLPALFARFRGRREEPDPAASASSSTVVDPGGLP
jgi:Cu/Ag efflux pump CusA